MEGQRLQGTNYKVLFEIESEALTRTVREVGELEDRVEDLEDELAETKEELQRITRLLRAVTEEARRDTEELHGEVDALRKSFRHELELKHKRQKK